MILDVVFALLGGLIGCLLCREYYRRMAWVCYEDAVEFEIELEEAEDLLEDFRVAARLVVHAIEQIGDDTDWANGPETFRRYEWHEVEPLAKCLEKQVKRERRIARGE